MDPALYKAAMEGNIDVLRQHQDQLCHQLTPRDNTVLHVAAQFPHNAECAKEILNLQPFLLLGVNSKGETALHIAARIGCENTVRELLDFPRTPNPADPEIAVAVTNSLLRMKNKENDTALHEAVRNNHLGVVELLLHADPDLSYATVNSAGETPLYLAAERHYHEIVSAILHETRRNQAYGGPNGKTALHGAVIANCHGCVEILLGKDQNLIQIGDSYGWTPLHFAACLNLAARADQLLRTDKSIAYLAANEDEQLTALHIAAKWDSFGVMRVFWQHCPDCWEMVNEKGRNVLHIAIENGRSHLIRKLLKSPFPISNLLHGKDEEGNTPLHLLAISDINIPELIWHHATNKGAFNKKNQTPRDAMLSEKANFNKESLEELIETGAPRGWRNKDSEDRDRLEKSRLLKEIFGEKFSKEYGTIHNSMIVAATLVATVTFAASFTVPGGFHSNEGPNKGTAVLARKAAFKAFVISNTIAVIFSISALVLLLFASYHLTHTATGRPRFFKLAAQFIFALPSLLLSLLAMMVSLITGSFAVLATSKGLAVAVCVIGGAFCLLFWVALCTFYPDVVAFWSVKILSRLRSYPDVVASWSGKFLSRLIRGIGVRRLSRESQT